MTFALRSASGPKRDARHRPSPLDAHEITVLKAGEIAERGRHEELIAQGGSYADMWDRRREAEEARERLKKAAEQGYTPRSYEAEAPVFGEA